MNLDKFVQRGMKAQSAVDDLVKINESTDQVWLRSVMTDRDATVQARTLAQRRLRELAKPKRK